jgi:hypothetical protein
MDDNSNYYLNKATENFKQYKMKLQRNQPVEAEKYKQHALDYLKMYKTYKQNISNQERIQSSLQRGTPTNQDIAQEAAELGIDINDLEEKEDYPEEKEDYPEEKEDYPEEKEDYPEEKEDYPEEKEDYLEGKEDYPEGKEDYPEGKEDNYNLQEELEEKELEEKELEEKELEDNNNLQKELEKNELEMLEKEKLPQREVVNTPTGFTESLIKTRKIKPKINAEICSNIYAKISNVNSNYVIPSQFPNLTRIKPFVFTVKKGGKRKKITRRKYRNKRTSRKNRNKY